MNAPAQATNLASLQQRQSKTKSLTEIPKLPKHQQFPAMLQTLQGEIRRALPAHLKPDRMARIALTCFRTNPRLAECEPASIFSAVLQAAQLGLEPGLLGQCYLIPYKDSRNNRTECQLQIGYQGRVELARRTGMIVSLEAHAVYTNDHFVCRFGAEPVLEHEPNWDGERGEFRLVYAVAHLKDGGRHIEVMSRLEIERIRDRSQNVKSAKKYNKLTPWDTDFEQMALKTVLNRICKFLPKSVELATAIALDEAAMAGRSQQLGIDDAIDGTWTPIYQDDGGEGDAATGEVADSEQQREPERDPDTGEVIPPHITEGQEAPKAAEKPRGSRRAAPAAGSSME